MTTTQTGPSVEDSCVTEEQARQLCDSGWWKEKMPVQLARWQLDEARLCMPMDVFLKCMHIAVGDDGFSPVSICVLYNGFRRSAYHVANDQPDPPVLSKKDRISFIPLQFRKQFGIGAIKQQTVAFIERESDLYEQLEKEVALLYVQIEQCPKCGYPCKAGNMCLRCDGTGYETKEGYPGQSECRAYAKRIGKEGVRFKSKRRTPQPKRSRNARHASVR